MRVQFGSLQTARLAVERGLSRCNGQDIGGRLGIHDGKFFLFGRERLHQRAAQILFAAQHSQTFARAFAHLCWICPEETGRTLDLAVCNREILADVMTLNPVSPRPILGMLPEYAKKISV